MSNLFDCRLHCDINEELLGAAPSHGSIAHAPNSQPPYNCSSEFTACVTCRPSFTTALERVPQAFTTQVLLDYTPPHRDICCYKDPSRRQYLTWQCSFFHPPSFQRHLLPSLSLPRPSLLSSHPECTHSVYTHTLDKAKQGKACFPQRDWDRFGV